MKILFLSHTAMDGYFVVGSHHLARECTLLGHDVIHVSSPITLGHLLLLRSGFIRSKFRKALLIGLSKASPIDIVPLTLLPWTLVKFSAPLRRLMYSPTHYIKSIIKRSWNTSPDLIVIDEPRLLDVIDLYKDCTVIYRPTDLYSKIRNDKSLDALEKQIVENGRYRLIAMSDPIKDNLLRIGAKEVLKIENGVDYELFSTPMALPNEIALTHANIAVYVGAFDNRFSLAHILSAAKLNLEVEFLLIGPASSEIQKLTSGYPNIRWLGPVDHHILPSILQRCKVGLLPLSTHPANQGRSPMKIYEYAAAGLPVVATTTNELQSRSLPFVSLCNTPIEFAKCIEQTFDECHKFNKDIPQRIAKQYSWKEIARVILIESQ